MHCLLDAQSLPLVRDPGDLEVVLIPDAGEWNARREALPGQFSTHVVSVVPHRELKGQVHARILPHEERTMPTAVKVIEQMLGHSSATMTLDTDGYLGRGPPRRGR